MAIACLERDAKEVLSIERYPEVIELSRINPWSQRLHGDERVNVVIGDALDVIRFVDADSFDSVFHDPPQIQLTPNLYDIDLYHLIAKVLKPGGRLCHYVGPKGFSYGGREVAELVRVRLLDSGFQSVDFLPHLQSILARRRDD